MKKNLLTSAFFSFFKISTIAFFCLNSAGTSFSQSCSFAAQMGGTSTEHENSIAIDASGNDK